VKYHLGFPPLVRASAGMSGAKLFVSVRAIVAIIYFSIQTFYAGKITTVLFTAVCKNCTSDAI
jgi:nucleobase:cation symporter-1, NCS1 family